MLTPLQAAQRQWVSQVILGRCLARFGFDYPDAGPQPTATSTALTTYSLLSRRYGVSDPDSVRRWGYHEPRGDSTGGKQTKTLLLAGLSPAEQKVMTGFDPATKRPAVSYEGRKIPPNGCRAEPDRALGAEPSPAPGTAAGKTRAANVVDGLVTRLKADSYQQSLDDPRVVAAFKKWSSCMKRSGYHETDPMLAPGKFLSSPSPRPAEIGTATADVSCKARTNLIGIWFAVESEYQDAAIRRHSGKLAEIKADLRRETANLTSLLSHEKNNTRD
nr:hypothetical protein [Streptomyces hygroscopicus]